MAVTNTHNIIESMKEMQSLANAVQSLSRAEGLKYDDNKPPIDLVDPSYLEGLARVLGFGARKYDRHNWRNGIAYSRLIAAAYRHLGAINKGEDFDSESGERHIYHLACCTQFLAWMMENRTDLDDRWKNNADVK